MAGRAHARWWEAVTGRGTVYRLPEPLPTERLARFCRRRGIRFVVLFGSSADGTNGPESDVDIAVMPALGRRPGHVCMYGDLVPIFLDERLDIVNLRNAPPLLAWHVACEGKLLYAADRWEWLRFCTHAVKEWDDVRRFQRYGSEYVDRAIERLLAR
jgi:predicted nucleotidyltransferase